MPVTSDIVKSYRAPGRVVGRLLARGPREDLAFVFLMISCVIIFVAQLPALARRAHLEGSELTMLLAGALMGWIVIAPLLFYALALLAYGVGRILGGRGSGYGARLALFWAMLASTPLIVLHGLTEGFIGDGPALQLVGFLWFVVFIWFWISGSIRQELGH